MRLWFSALLGIQVFDALIHIFSDQVEPLRLVASFLILFALLMALWKPMKETRLNLLRLGLAGYLILNAVHIYQNGWPGVLFWLLIAATTILTWLFWKKMGESLAGQGT